MFVHPDVFLATKATTADTCTLVIRTQKEPKVVWGRVSFSSSSSTAGPDAYWPRSLSNNFSSLQFFDQPLEHSEFATAAKEIEALRRCFVNRWLPGMGARIWILRARFRFAPRVIG